MHHRRTTEGQGRRKVCPVCLLLRTVVLALLMGGGGGYLVAQMVGPGRLSMLATFFGAFLPVLWYARERNRRP